MIKKLAHLSTIVFLLCLLSACGEKTIIKEHDKEILNSLDNGKIDILGQKYKDINDIKQEKLQVDTDRKYVTPTVDKMGEKYVKYSDTFESPAEERDGEFVEMDGVELLPTKIYTTNPEDRFLYKYKDELYYIPVVLCEKESDERIEYRDYGFTLWRDNSVSVNGKKVSNLISGDWRHEYLSDTFEVEYEHAENFYIAYTSVWKVEDINKVNYKNYEITSIYEYDYDGDVNTPELLMATGFREHVHTDNTRVEYNLFSVNKDGKFMYSKDNVLWLAQIPRVKNMFFGERGVWTKDKIYGIKENVYVGYWVYDKNEGLCYIERFANGENLDSKRFSETFFSLDEDYYLHGQSIDLIHNWSSIDEEGNVTYDKNNMLKAGTKVKIKEFSVKEATVKFVLENGEEISFYFGG